MTIKRYDEDPRTPEQKAADEEARLAFEGPCGLNRDKPVLEIKYFVQERISLDKWRVHCPVCETGVLLVGRGVLTYCLLARDNCIFCGQRVIYLDIDKMRKMENGIA